MIFYQDSKLDVIFAEGGLTEVATYLRSTERQWKYSYSENNGASQSWDLNTNYRRAWELAHTGWTEGALDLSARLGVLPPNEAEPEYFYDVAGYVPDVPLFCSGEPMHMKNYGHPDGRKPIVHLVINGWVLASITATEYRNYGAAMVAMIQQIEATGRQCEIDMVFAGRQRVGNILLGWKVKRAGDNVDLSAVAFSVSHPAAFRRIGFALIERTHEREQSPGYGYNATMKPEFAEIINAKGAFLLGGVGGSVHACKTLDGALRFAANEINKAAGEELVTVK